MKGLPRFWLAAALIAPVAIVVGELGFIVNGVEPLESFVLDVGVAIAAVAAGLILWRRFPDNKIGLLLYLSGVLWAIQGIGAFMGPWWSVASLMTSAHGALYVHLLFAYPIGRLTTRPSKVAVSLGYGALLLNIPRTIFQGPGSCEGCEHPNRWLVQDWPEIVDASFLVFDLVFVVITAIGIFTMASRWWHAGPLGRRTYTPVLVSALFLACVVLVVNIHTVAIGQRSWWAYPLLAFGHLLVPIGFLVGLFRRTFDRAAIGEMVVELEHIAPGRDIQQVLAEKLHDPSLLVGYWDPEENRYFDSGGGPVDLGVEGIRSTTSIENDGEKMAILVHDPALEQDPAAVQAVVTAVRLVMRRERLETQVRAQLEEVRASRVRIVEATEEERRRVERDLHDGAQQRLLALMMALRMTREQSGEQHVRGLLEEAEGEARAALSDMRELAQGIYPAVLTTEGLRAAVEVLAERSPVPVVLEMNGARAPQAVETSSYFVISEALSNTIKHSEASKVTVSSERSDGVFRIKVADDGVGGVRADEGSGLRGMADRVAAYDGVLVVDSPPGEGTVIRVDFPIG